MTTVHAFRRAAMLPAAALFLAACSDRTATSPEAPSPLAPGSPPAQLAAVCRADVRAGTVECGAPAPAGGASRTIFGGQDVNVKLVSTNVSWNAGTEIFSFDITVQNLLPQAMGTADGTTPHADGVRVFFAQEPATTGGEGDVTVANEDGMGTFTAGSQPYFQYDQVLAPQQVSEPRNWQLNVPESVSTFSFLVFISTQLPPLLVINEIMANPNVVADASGEWFEIYNAGLNAVDLNGWVIRSGGGSVDLAGHTINTSVVVPGRGYAVIAAVSNSATNGGVTASYAYGTAITLANNTTDWLVLRTPGGAQMDSVSWGAAAGETAASPPAGSSRALGAPLSNNLYLSGATSKWFTSNTPYGPGDNNGTPGADNGAVVVPGPVDFVSVSPSFVQVRPGSTVQFSAQARDSVGNVANTTYTWSTSNTGIATVNPSTGLVTAVADGEVQVIATAENGVFNSRTLQVFTEDASVVYRNHLELGTPTDGNAADEILLNKTQFSLSYSEARGGPNWVSWNLNRSQFGYRPRCDCFSPDASLPPGVYQVVTGDYIGSGWTRGHMVRSEERTQTDADNASTFLMTNILPQHADLNSGPWGQLEFHLESLAKYQGKEMYVIAGGIYSGSPATLKNEGKVQIPASTWKIVVIVDAGEGLASISSAADLQIIAVNMPNVAGIAGQPWNNPAYLTTVDAIEAATGYDFLSALPDAIEAAVEAGS
ncbi:MAG TPA: DNA/RNA non-specific endonuclease [Longimicrobium sp.]|nr:DNA/RNA non-specific endonuclease [Longimicrobium sp.]